MCFIIVIPFLFVEKVAGFRKDLQEEETISKNLKSKKPGKSWATFVPKIIASKYRHVFSIGVLINCDRWEHGQYWITFQGCATFQKVICIQLCIVYNPLKSRKDIFKNKQKPYILSQWWLLALFSSYKAVLCLWLLDILRILCSICE